ncbi:MAG: aldo/keto reductase [Chthoniobacterales bacterium]
MIYRRFGRTELAMPVITCGGMRYQQSWQDEGLDKVTPSNQENLEKTIHRAVEMGINHIETARGYGTSEIQLGLVLPKFSREKIILQTKIVPSENPAEFLERFDKSMKNLQLDYVDLLGIHGINTPELLKWTLMKGGALEEARKLQKSGRVRHVGFSTHADLNTITDTINTGEFDYVNLHWYYVNQQNWPAITAAGKHDMGVFIISPNDKGGKLYQPSAKLRKLCEPVTPMVFNDLFCLARPEVHTLSMGVSKPSDFDDHLEAVRLFEKVQEVLPPIEKRLNAEIEKVIGPLWPVAWTKGLPDASEMTGQVNVREIIRLWFLVKALDMVAFAKDRYNLFGEGGHWFPGIQAAEFDQEKILTSITSSTFRDRAPEILREAHDAFAAEPKKRLSQSK